MIAGAVEIFEERRVIPQMERRQNTLAKHCCLDEVTELPKRELMLSYLRGQLDLYPAHGLPFSAVLIQLDRMQLFQAAHRHEAVRSITQVVAHTMREVLRSTDFLGRWEGDRFLAILPCCSETCVEKVAHRLKATVSGSGIYWWGDRLSIEVLVASTSGITGDTVESVIERMTARLKQLANETAASAIGGGV